MPECLHSPWFYLVLTDGILSAIASGHAVLFKKDVRSAIGWGVTIWLMPFAGSVFYLLFGINHIQRRASILKGNHSPLPIPLPPPCSPDQLASALPHVTSGLLSLERMVRLITGLPLAAGNRITPLMNGDEAYPAMMEAIRNARTSISLSSYIFGNDTVGHLFVETLAQAVQRGVSVRVLIDHVGSRYSIPPVTGRLRKAGIPVATFLPTFVPWRTAFMNLRNHRKILVVDGTIAFTGGMNIRANNLLATHPPPPHPVQDLHFRVEGPVVSHLQHAFGDDWLFTTGERLESSAWFPSIPEVGPVIARGITDGPDEDYDKLRRVLIGALACARRSVRIVTPYFLPDLALISALNVTAMRGVSVEILIPEKGNLRILDWATRAQLWQVLECGCRVWLTPPPFDHAKLMVVDGTWSLLGSANWDPRSLRLNFEFDLECYGTTLAGILEQLIEQRKSSATPISLADVDRRALLVRLRDSLCRLFSPYL